MRWLLRGDVGEVVAAGFPTFLHVTLSRSAFGVTYCNIIVVRYPVCRKTATCNTDY